MTEPRGWQRDFLEGWLAWSETDYLLAAIPASGKTMATLFCARRFLQEPKRALVILAPTTNVQKNWRDTAAAEFKIQLCSAFDEYQRGGYDGIVLTYQALTDATAGLLRWLSSRVEIMVAADEIHHLNDDATWGDRYRQAFEFAVRRLAVTGTPFRSNPGERIPFLQVDEASDSYVLNFEYDYPSALEDHHIRALEFHCHEYEITKTIVGNDGTWRTWYLSTKDKDLSGDDADELLRKAIWDRDFVHNAILAADLKLQWKRKFVPDAAGLIIARDHEHALWLAPIIEQMTGQRPDVLISDEKVSTTTVDDFRHGNRRWIVAVNKISEGTDIPRLAVLVLLTSKKTLLSFRQAVGRIMRRRIPDDEREQWAYCFIVNHPELHQFARTIEDWQQKVIGSAVEPDEPRAPASRSGINPDVIYSDSNAEQGSMIARGEEYQGELSHEASDLSARTGYDEAIIADILKAQAQARAPSPGKDDANDEPLEQRLRTKSRAIESLARRWAFKDLNGDFKEANRRLCERYSKSRSRWTEQEMDDALLFLKDLLQ